MKRFILSFITLLNSLTSNAKEIGLDRRIDEAFQPISDFFNKYVFYPVSMPFGDYPFVIYLLVGSALFFTIYFIFPNVRYLKTAINVVAGNMIKLNKLTLTLLMVRFLIFKHWQLQSREL